jgi:DNA-binding SARP family transcriptional activator
VMTIDAAIEALWPGADPDVGRNRLHGVMLRLRRGLGLPASGPISCTEGVVRMERTGSTEIDAWEFEGLAGGTDPDARAAVDRYTGDVLSAQYAYDDTVEAYRQRLHRLFVRAATAVLEAPPPGCDATYVSSLAYRAWASAPDDEAVCRAAAGALARERRVAQARELIERTAHAWIDLGLDGDALRVRTLHDLGLPR